MIAQSLHEYLVDEAKNLQELGQPDSYQAYVLRNGQPFESTPLTKEELAYVLKITKGLRFPIKQCYANSQRLLMFHDLEQRMTYVEGYCARIIPVLHGWLEIEGKVVDLTMRSPQNAHRQRLRDRILGDWTDGREYIGVRFDREYVRERTVARRAFMTLIDDFQGGYPLLNRGERTG